jgi:hypothetical protein
MKNIFLKNKISDCEFWSWMLFEMLKCQYKYMLINIEQYWYAYIWNVIAPMFSDVYFYLAKKNLTIIPTPWAKAIMVNTSLTHFVVPMCLVTWFFLASMWLYNVMDNKPSCHPKEQSFIVAEVITIVSKLLKILCCM